MVPVSSPFDANSHLKKNLGEAISQYKYAQMIGSLMHLIIFTRLDITYDVCR